MSSLRLLGTLTLLWLGMTPMAYCILASFGLLPNILDAGWLP